MRELWLSLLASPVLLLTGRASIDKILRGLKAYRNAKMGAQRAAGKLMFAAFSADGGDSFCARIQYCRNKSKLAELLAHSGNPEFAAIAAQYSETIEWIRGALAELIEVLGDSVIPLSFLLLSLKEGLDDLCHCCSLCNGVGSSPAGPCPRCGGSGVGPRKP
ncbi:MAG: hypothetical protein M3O61_10600 [Gemmatimonadota bacterium]|nr:hypothetical protein [Gemmatimonadota bacterium]